MNYFSSYKGRQVAHAQRVQVYRNLNRPGITYSVRDVNSRLVLGHTDCILLGNCTFTVSQKGRQRVLDTGHKNVHAWIEGNYLGPYYEGWKQDYGPKKDSHMVYYNPWDYEEFTAFQFCRDYDPDHPTANIIESAGLVLIDSMYIVAHSVGLAEYDED